MAREGSRMTREVRRLARAREWLATMAWLAKREGERRESLKYSARFDQIESCDG